MFEDWQSVGDSIASAGDVDSRRHVAVVVGVSNLDVQSTKLEASYQDFPPKSSQSGTLRPSLRGSNSP